MCRRLNFCVTSHNHQKPQVASLGNGRDRPQKHEQFQQAGHLVRSKSFAESARQIRLADARHEVGSGRLPERSLYKLVPPPSAPTVQRGPAHHQHLSQLGHALRGQPVIHRGNQYDDQGWINPSPQKTNRLGRLPTPTALLGAAKAKASHLSVNATRASRIVCPVKLSTAMGTGLGVDQFREILVGLFNQTENLFIEWNLHHRKPFVGSVGKGTRERAGDASHHLQVTPIFPVTLSEGRSLVSLIYHAQNPQFAPRFDRSCSLQVNLVSLVMRVNPTRLRRLRIL